jgi:hypothetical protein
MIIDLIIMNINELINFARVVPKNPVVASFILHTWWAARAIAPRVVARYVMSV